MNKVLENLIDEIVKIIDEEIFEDFYSKKTAIVSEEEVENERDALRDILEPYVDDAELLKALKQVGVEYTDEYEEAVKIYGKPIYE